MDEKEITLTPEELQEEQEALAEVEDDKLRSSVVSSLGLEDNDQNKELIDKLVADKKTSKEKLSKAIGQKIKLREALKGKQPPVQQSQPPAPPKPLDAEEIRKQAEATTRAQLDEEFLEESDFSDEIKNAIREEAKRTGTSARKASKSEFVQFKLGREKEAKRINEAADNGAGKGKKGSAVDPSKPLNPADFDLSTEEGRKAWADAKKARRPKS